MWPAREENLKAKEMKMRTMVNLKAKEMRLRTAVDMGTPKTGNLWRKPLGRQYVNKKTPGASAQQKRDSMKLLTLQKRNPTRKSLERTL